jgi:hypothetical protein
MNRQDSADDVIEDEDQNAWDAWLGDDLHGYPRDGDEVHPAQWCVQQLSQSQGREESDKAEVLMSVQQKNDKQCFVLERPPLFLGGKSRLLSLGRQAKAHAHKESYRAAGKVFSLLGHLVLYGILGYTAARLVEVSETFNNWDFSANAKKCTIQLSNFTNKNFPPECSYESLVPALTAVKENFTYTNAFYNPECYALNGSTKVMVPLTDDGLCICIQDKHLPDISTIYWSAALFTIFNVATAMCEFFATTYDADWAATIFTIYGALKYMIEHLLNLRKENQGTGGPEEEEFTVVDAADGEAGRFITWTEANLPNPLGGVVTAREDEHPTAGPGEADDATVGAGEDDHPTGGPGEADDATGSVGDVEHPTVGAGEADDATAGAGEADDATAGAGEADDATVSPGEDETPTAGSEEADDETVGAGEADDATVSPGEDENPITGLGEADDAPLIGAEECEDAIVGAGDNEDPSGSADVEVEVTDYFTPEDPEVNKIRLPELRPMPRDDLLIYCGILGVVLIGLGNWLVALNSVTAGLYVAVVSSLGLKAAIVASVDSSKTIDKTVLGVVEKILRWAENQQYSLEAKNRGFTADEIEHLKSQISALKKDMQFRSNNSVDEALDQRLSDQSFKLKPVADQLDLLLGIASEGEWSNNGTMRKSQKMGNTSYQVLYIGHKSIGTRLRDNSQYYKTLAFKNKLLTYGSIIEKFGRVVGYLFLGGIATTVCELQIRLHGEGKCAQKHDLPKVYLIYAAAGIVVVTRLVSAFLNWRAHMADSSGLRGRLTTAWNHVCHVFDKPELYRTKGGQHHESIQIAIEADVARIYEALLCTLGMAAGYYIMLQGPTTLTVGLFMIIVFGFGVGNATQGYVDSENGVSYAQHSFITTIANWTETWLTAKHIQDVDGLSKAEKARLTRWRNDSLEKLKLARKELDAVMRSLTTAKSTFELRYQS